jgi:hypothetical protein
MNSRFVGKLLGRVVSLAVILCLAAPPVSASEFLYFAPGEHTSPDGKYTLAAIKDGGDIRFYYVTASGLNLQIVSDPVFDARETPDVSGLGPYGAWFSVRQRDQDEHDPSVYPQIVGEWVVTLWQGRFTSQVAVHSITKLEGGTWLANVPLEFEKIKEAGRKALDKKLEAAGLPQSGLPGWRVRQSSVSVVGESEGVFDRPAEHVFELREGFYLEVDEQLDRYIEDEERHIHSHCSVIVHVVPDGTGGVATEIVKVESSIDED